MEEHERVTLEMHEEARRIMQGRPRRFFRPDYSELTEEERAQTDPEMDDLLKRSRVVSVKRGL